MINYSLHASCVYNSDICIPQGTGLCVKQCLNVSSSVIMKTLINKAIQARSRLNYFMMVTYTDSHCLFVALVPVATGNVIKAEESGHDCSLNLVGSK